MTAKKPHAEDAPMNAKKPHAEDAADAAPRQDAPPPATVTPADLEQFMGVPLSEAHAMQSIAAAHATLEAVMGQPLPHVLGHNLAQAERHLAAHMAITDRQTPLPADEIPAVARYFLMLESATAARGDKL